MPILQTKKLRLGEVKSPWSGHQTYKWNCDLIELWSI